MGFILQSRASLSEPSPFLGLYPRVVSSQRWFVVPISPAVLLTLVFCQPLASEPISWYNSFRRLLHFRVLLPERVRIPRCSWLDRTSEPPTLLDFSSLGFSSPVVAFPGAVLSQAFRTARKLNCPIPLRETTTGK